MYFRFSLLFFLQFCTLGSLSPILSLYLNENLGFSGVQIGLIMSVSSISAILSPLIVTSFADRYVSTRNMLIFCYLGIAISFFLLAQQKLFWPFLILYFVFVTVSNPSTGLLNSFTMARLKDTAKEYTPIRMWGTIGWMAISLFIGYLWLGKLGRPAKEVFYVGIFFALLLAITLLFFPSLKLSKEKSSHKKFFPKEILDFFLEKDILILSFIMLVMAVVLRFYVVSISIFLSREGVAFSWVMPIMALGQLSEIVAMLIFGRLFSKWGFKKVLMLGILFEILRFSFLTFGNSLGIYVFGILCHGFAYSFVSMTAMVYLDKRAGNARRAGAQQIFSVISVGLGSFLGNNLAGFLLDYLKDSSGETNFTLFWFIPWGISILMFIFFSLFFKRGTFPSVLIEETKQS